MMKQVLLVLFFTIFSVQSKITSLNKTLLMKPGDSARLFCDKPEAKWRFGNQIVVNCTHCPSSTCDVHPPFAGHVSAYCTQVKSVLHFKSTVVGDKGLLYCPGNGSDYFRFLVGSYDHKLRPENNSVLENESYTLIYHKRYVADIKLYNQTGAVLRFFNADCKNGNSAAYDTNKFNITCDLQSQTVRLQIKSVHFEDDGHIFGCESDKKLSLYRLTVDVAVTSVLINQQSKSLIENKEEIFICDAGHVKPIPSYQWITVDKDNKEEIQTEYNITNTRIGKVWQTKSYLKLKLKKAYKRIKCRARIKEMDWKNSTSQSLDIQYPPDITVLSKDVTKLKQKAHISCTAQANPNNINYTLEQKWGKIVKRRIVTNKKDFNNLSFEDLGTWTCQTSNGVPKGDYYTEKSVKIEVDVPVHFKGSEKETVTVGSTQKLKACYYCNPSATEVKWYKGDEEMPSHRIEYCPAEDGQFPFTGNCSVLKLDIKEKTIQIYSLHVTNPVGKEVFKVTLDSGHPDNGATYIIIACVVISLIIFGVISGVFFIRNQRSKNKTQSNNNLHESNSTDGEEIINNSLYGEAYGITDHAAHVEELYAQVDKSKKTPSQDKNENLYANCEATKPTKPKPTKPRKKDALPKEEIHENLERNVKKTDKRELMYATLEFTHDKAENKEDPINLDGDQTMYASIDFLKTEPEN